MTDQTRLIPSSFDSASPSNGTPAERDPVGTISTSIKGGISRLDITVTISLYPATMAADPPAEQPKTSRSWKRRQQKKRQQAREAAAVEVIEEPTTVGLAFAQALSENGVPA